MRWTARIVIAALASLSRLTVFLLEGEEGAHWGSWWGGAGLTVIRMGEREGPRSNRAGKCWWEWLDSKGFYGLPRRLLQRGLALASNLNQARDSQAGGCSKAFFLCQPLTTPLVAWAKPLSSPTAELQAA